jgi:poly-beta-hydroxyalkanoate depolymerase
LVQKNVPTKSRSTIYPPFLQQSGFQKMTNTTTKDSSISHTA